MGAIGLRAPPLGRAEGRRRVPRTLCSRVVFMLLVFVLAWTAGKADDRTPYYMLNDVEIGDHRRHGGGSTSYSMRRQHSRTWHMSREEMDGERADAARTLRDGYSPGKAFREDTIIWSYNCQMANSTRLRAWSYEFKGAMVLMQGTQRQYDPSKGERALCQWQTEHHDVVEFRVRGKKTGGPSA